MKKSKTTTVVAVCFIVIGLFYIGWKWFNSEEKSVVNLRPGIEKIEMFAKTNDERYIREFKDEICSGKTGVYCNIRLSEFVGKCLSRNHDSIDATKACVGIAMKNGCPATFSMNGNGESINFVSMAIDAKYKTEIIDFLVKDCKLNPRNNVGIVGDSGLLYSIKVKNPEAALYFIREFPEMKTKPGKDGKLPIELAKKYGLSSVEAALK
jgi:hypothetical protein